MPQNSKDRPPFGRPRPHSVPVSQATFSEFIFEAKQRYGFLILAAIIFLGPLFVYQRTIFYHFGLRDDYSNIRESHEEPGKIVRFTASHGRPIYGWLLQHSYERVHTVHDLQWLRLLGVVGLGSVSVLLLVVLRKKGWSLSSAFFTAALLTLVPSAQVIASWAITWPYMVGSFFSLGGFFLSDRAPNKFSLRNHALGAMGVGIAGLIYQPSALFYTIGVAGALASRRGFGLKHGLIWLGRHLATIVAGLGFAFVIIKTLYAGGVFQASGRIAFEHDFSGKLWWFLQEPLLNSMSLFVINDDDAATWPLYSSNAQAVAVFLAVGLGVERALRGKSEGILWLSSLAILPLVAVVVSMIAAERFATYRTIHAMTGVIVVFLSLSWQNICALTGRQGRYLQLAGYLCFAICAVWFANSHPFKLIAVPQSQELQIIQQAADKVVLSAHPRIFFIEPSLDDSPTSISYHDEFGSLSTNSDWVPKEIFKHVMREKFPDVANRESMYVFRSGLKLSKTERYDVLINMHNLKRFGAPYTGPFVDEIP